MARVTRIRHAVALATRGRVVGQLDGVHASVHVGRSLDFNDLREYVPGDDVTDIDWRATARSGSLLVKRHVAERRTTLLVALSSGRGMAGLASPTTGKADIALDAAAALGVLANSFGDHAGMIWCADGRTHTARPSTRLVELERQLGTIEAAISPEAAPADIDALLGTAASTMRRRGVLAIISDDVDIDAQLEARIRWLSAQHRVLWITIPDVDPTEPALFDRRLLDLDRGGVLPDWITDEALRAELRDDRTRRTRSRTAALARLGVAETTITDPTDVVTRVLTMVRRTRHVR